MIYNEIGLAVDQWEVGVAAASVSSALDVVIIVNMDACIDLVLVQHSSESGVSIAPERLVVVLEKWFVQLCFSLVLVEAINIGGLHFSLGNLLLGLGVFDHSAMESLLLSEVS